MNDIVRQIGGDLQVVKRAIEDGNDLDRQLASQALDRVLKSLPVVPAGVPKDPLLGGAIASPDLSISRASIDDMGVELARRDWGQPAVLAYQDRPGVWAVRLSATMDDALLWKVSSIMLSMAHVGPTIAADIRSGRRGLEKTYFPNTQVVAGAFKRRALELRLKDRWRLIKLAAAAAAGFALHALLSLV